MPPSDPVRGRPKCFRSFVAGPSVASARPSPSSALGLAIGVAEPLAEDVCVGVADGAGAEAGLEGVGVADEAPEGVGVGVALGDVDGSLGTNGLLIVTFGRSRALAIV